MNLFCVLEIFFGGKMEKMSWELRLNYLGFFSFFFPPKKLPSDLGKSAYQTRIRFSKFSLNLFCKIDPF